MCYNRYIDYFYIFHSLFAHKKFVGLPNYLLCKKLLLSAEHQLRVIATTEYILNIHAQDIPLVPNADKQQN